MYIVVALIIIVPLSYGMWFRLHLNAPISDASDNWGTFGDFVGVLLNPTVAFFAFYWLIKSVRIQKEELFETRKALEDSAESQQLQVKLAALNTLIASIMSEVDIQRNQLKFLTEKYLKFLVSSGGSKGY